MTKLHIPPKGNKNLMSPLFMKNRFSKEECNTLVENITREKSVAADIKRRDAFAICLNLTKGNEWLFEKITAIINEANNSFYHFDLTDLRAINFLEYQVNNSLAWHRDIGGEKIDFLTRKITMILFLSDVNDYEGGKLAFIPGIDFDLIQEQGSVLLYPSYLVHNVEKVTGGIRRVLLASAHGHSYR